MWYAKPVLNNLNLSCPCFVFFFQVYSRYKMQEILNDIFIIANKARITANREKKNHYYSHVSNNFRMIIEMETDRVYKSQIQSLLMENKNHIPSVLVFDLIQKYNITFPVIKPKFKKNMSPSLSAYLNDRTNQIHQNNLFIEVCKRVIPSRINKFTSSVTIPNDVNKIFAKGFIQEYDFIKFFKYRYQQHNGKFIGISYHFNVDISTMKITRYRSTTYQFCIPTELFKDPNLFFNLIPDDLDDDRSVDKIFFNNFIYVVRIKNRDGFHPVLFKFSNIHL